ncbi:hypothetical protein [Gordonia rubripertincta]|uniref:hypothetical protein n=1 Tax=Gordonia rubripertincta TaxID=36822 RepID=UPI000B8DA797|nr:hypothetical protein [Gordonia rubripertincta]ASR04209.1 hypothetical protein GCWB2_17150 [Gordonia rubripertincta]
MTSATDPMMEAITEAVGDERARTHHAALDVAAFYPSLHLNLADGFRRLGSFDAARRHVEAAREHMSALPAEAYGDLIRAATEQVAAAVADRDTAERASAPGAAR